MKDYVTVIAAVVAGIFALISAYLAWRLKSSADASERSLAESRERRQEMKDLYASVIATLEQSIKTVQSAGEFSLDKELSEINGKLHLIGSEASIRQYHDVAERIRKWSSLHIQASPRRMSIGGDTILLIQSPDPTEKFKQPALDAYRELQGALECMIKQMRAEVRDWH
ncbi:hypothetical protein [Burkholderia gladioli]|uniref:hypothetical protein n=1 Tax=Burkholderia gladioli TaxID=28095 RepID=UPI00163ECDD8|nr:hypothetical protein [Burkholderia gladioli]